MRAVDWKWLFDEWGIDAEGRANLHLLAQRGDRGLAEASSIMEQLRNLDPSEIAHPPQWLHKATSEARVLLKEADDQFYGDNRYGDDTHGHRRRR